jgi:hypothetical protein
LGEAFEFSDFVEEPWLGILELEDDRLAGVFQAVVLFPVSEAVEVTTPVEAVQEVGFLGEVELHGGIDTAADLQAEAGFAQAAAELRHLDQRALLPARIMMWGYQRLFERLMARGYGLPRPRPRLTRGEKLQMAAYAMGIMPMPQASASRA